MAWEETGENVLQWLLIFTSRRWVTLHIYRRDDGTLLASFLLFELLYLLHWIPLHQLHLHSSRYTVTN